MNHLVSRTGRAAGVNPAGLRRDLSFLGTHGVRGVGYDVGKLIDEIRRVLGAITPSASP